MKKKILVLSPHTDDGEIGCGASISKYHEIGYDIYYAVFSMCEKSLPKGFPAGTLHNELLSALKILQVSPRNTFLFNYEVRELPKYRQSILENMIEIKKKIKPDIIFTPSSTDIHQDHHTIYEESRRAFRQTTILGYEQPWNNITFKNEALSPVKKRHLQKKINALKCYKTQADRKYLNEDFIWSLAKTRGTQMELDYAEGFEVIRLIINDNL